MVRRVQYWAERTLRHVVPRRLHRPLRESVARVQAPLHRGSARYCPCCERSFSRFLSDRGQPDTTCPRCWSGQRHRVLVEYLRTDTDFFVRPHDVLHVAPERCLEGRFRRLPNLSYVTADLEAPADIRLDLTDASLPDSSFDVVICLHVLEHIGDDRRALREIHRILRPGGFAIIDVPLDEREETFEPEARTPKERLRLLGQEDHVRFYGRSDLVRRLTSAGFDVDVVRFDERMSAQRARVLGLRGTETLHICRRDD